MSLIDTCGTSDEEIVSLLLHGQCRSLAPTGHKHGSSEFCPLADTSRTANKGNPVQGRMQAAQAQKIW